jgi:hypothetical protein
MRARRADAAAATAGLTRVKERCAPERVAAALRTAYMPRRANT